MMELAISPSLASMYGNPDLTLTTTLYSVTDLNKIADKIVDKKSDKNRNSIDILIDTDLIAFIHCRG